MRTGLIAQKLGMSRVFTDAGDHIPVTVLRVDNCQVVAHRTQERDHENARQGGQRGLSAADGRFPKRPQLEPVNVQPTPHDAAPTEDIAARGQHP